MFTGIVQTQATVVAIKELGDIRQLVISVENSYLEKLNRGASIAINGVCLTVVEFELGLRDVVGQVHFDVIDESLAVTNLSQVKQGDKVNFERSVTFGTEIGGHIVSGHVQTKAKLIEIQRSEHNCAFKLEVPHKWIKYIFEKGFVCVDGISLTVGEVDKRLNTFMLHLIPETLLQTNLSARHVADELNIEIDQNTFTMVQSVDRYLKEHLKRINFEG